MLCADVRWLLDCLELSPTSCLQGPTTQVDVNTRPSEDAIVAAAVCRADQLSGYELRGAAGRPEHNITLLHRAQQVLTRQQGLGFRISWP